MDKRARLGNQLAQLPGREGQYSLCLSCGDFSLGGGVKSSPAQLQAQGRGFGDQGVTHQVTHTCRISDKLSGPPGSVALRRNELTGHEET